MAPGMAKQNMTTFEKLIKIGADSKISLNTVQLEDADEVIQCLAAECDADENYFMKPRFIEVLEAVVTIIKALADIPNKTIGLLKFCNSMFQLLSLLLKQDSVRITLRDRHKLLFLVSRFFDTSLPQSGVVLVLGILEATSRNMVIDWKPPQLALLLKNLYTFISGHPQPSLPLAFAFQLLVNICQQNPSCTLIGKLDGTHKKVNEVLKGFWNKYNQNRTLYLLGIHLMIHYEQMLPADVLNAGYSILTTATAQAVANYRSETGIVDDLAPTFLQLKDFVTTCTSKLEHFFTNARNMESVQDDLQVDNRLSVQIMTEIKETFIKTSVDVLKRLKGFVSASPTGKYPRTSDQKVIGELLEFVISLLPHFIPVSQHIESHKEALCIANTLFEPAEEGSHVYAGCLSVYVHILELVMMKQEIFDKLVVERLFGLHVLNKINLTVNFSPTGVELNIISIRLLALLTESIYSEDVSKKLDLGVVRYLVDGLADVEDILPILKKRRTNCLLELLAIMAKYNRNGEMLNQLLDFVKTESVSNLIASAILNGDKRAVKNAITVTSIISFEFTALSCITESVLRVKKSWETMESRIDRMMRITPMPMVSNSTLYLEQALKSLPSPRHGGFGESPVEDILTWYNLKLELHYHELDSANQNNQQLHETIERLKILLEKQFQMVSKQAAENDSRKTEMLSLQHSFVCRQKCYTAKTASLEQELTSLKSEMETERVNATQVRGLLEVVKAEKEELTVNWNREIQVRTEISEKYKALRENTRNMKGDIARLQAHTTEKERRIADLEIALKEKEDESTRNRVLYDREKRTLDTIRGVVGANFVNLNLPK